MISQSLIQLASEAEIQSARIDIDKEKEILGILNAAYPGYVWHVEVKRLLGDIKCLNLSGQMGVRTDFLGSYSASELKRQVVMAGGELLEHYRQSRQRLNMNNLMDVPRDFAGRLAFDT